MRNRIAVFTILGVMVAGALALNHSQKTGPLQIAQAIDGNSTLEPAPTSYTVLCYPKNWRQDPASQQLHGDLGKPGFQKLLNATTVHTYVDGDAGFEHRFQSDSNSGPVATLPAVVVMSDGKQVYKRSGESVKYAANEVGKIVDKLCPCRPKPNPEPEPTPEPDDDRPTVPEVPDSVGPDAIVSDTDPVLVALCLAVGGFVGWLAMFKRAL